MSAYAKAAKLALPASIALAAMPSGIINNESKKRNFYEDDENVTPIPGTIVPASASEIESLGPNKLIDGISVRSPPFFESFFNNFRKSSIEVLQSFENSTGKASKDYYQLEHNVTSTVANLHDKREDLLPGATYVATAFLTGSIIARRRGFLLRFGAPLVLSVVAFKLALPSTFANTTGFLHGLEKQNLPAVADAQDSLVSELGKTIESVETTAKSTKQSVDDTLQSSKKRFAAITGLNINDDVTKK